MTAEEIREAMVGEMGSKLFEAVKELATAFREEAVEAVKVARTEAEVWKASGALETADNFREELERQMKQANANAEAEEKK